MGVADLPIELLKALRIKPSENSNTETDSQITSRSATSTGTGSSLNPSSLASSNIEVTASPSSSQSSLISPSITHSAQKVPSISSQGLDEAISNIPKPSSNPPKQQLDVSNSRGSHRKSMGHVLGDSRSRSSSRERSSLDSSAHRPLSASQAGHISLDAAIGGGKGIGRIVGAGLKSPMDFTLGLARGFHNAPKLYGDDSVRHPDKVTGIQSGLKAAGKVRFRQDASFFVLALIHGRDLVLVYMTVYRASIRNRSTEPSRKVWRASSKVSVKGLGAYY